MLYHLLFSLLAGALAGIQSRLLELPYSTLIGVAAGVAVWLMALRFPALLCGAIYGIPYGIASALTHAPVHGGGTLSMVVDGIAYGFGGFLFAWTAARGDFGRFVGGKPW